MSRDLSYRVWDEEKKEYSDKSFSLDQYGLLYVQDEDGYWEEASDRYIIEFSTGLEDKNGKEIYEGDVIQCHLSPISSTIFTGVVEFRPGCIMFKNFADGGAYAFNFLGAIEAVIGNIHDDPELLGDEGSR